jgi:alkylhydroperoxidase family enzyme
MGIQDIYATAPRESAVTESRVISIDHSEQVPSSGHELETPAAAMRLPYADPSSLTAPDDKAVVARVEARRAPRPLQALDLTLLHSPAVADGWNSFLGAIRTKTSLAADVREIAICRVAVRNEAWYEWMHHAPLAREGGVSEEGMGILGEADAAARKGAAGLTEKQWAVVAYADAMTRDVAVEQEVFDALKQHFSEKEVVEITATVGGCPVPNSHHRDHAGDPNTC